MALSYFVIIGLSQASILFYFTATDQPAAFTMITKDKVIEIFCIIDEFDKNLSDELSKNLRLPSVDKDGLRRRNRPGRMSESEIMTVLVCCDWCCPNLCPDEFCLVVVN